MTGDFSQGTRKMPAQRKGLVRTEQTQSSASQGYLLYQELVSPADNLVSEFPECAK